MKKGLKFLKNKTKIKTDFLVEGESLEEKMRRVTTTNEPIENVAPLLYTERKEGVLPECDIRTDRWEIAQNAMGAVSKSYAAKRENRQKIETESKQE